MNRGEIVKIERPEAGVYNANRIEHMRILIVEDDDRIAAPVADDLRRQHHAVDIAEDGDLGLAFARSGVYDVILLDVLLPGKSGVEICRTLRGERSSAMIIMVTARDATADVVAGLDAGADDYLVKPFDLEELGARLRALGRRSAPVRDAILQRGDIALDPAARLARFGQKQLGLTPTEFVILETLMRHPLQVFSRGMLLEKVASLERQTGDEAIKSHVANLRRKIRSAGCAHDPIETVYGNGYRLCESPTSP
jgi:DNA-binding response OmpR family regulator